MIWARTGRGKKMPLDAEPSAAGDFVLEGDDETPTTYKLSAESATTYTGDKYTTHFKTCPKADFRNRKRDSES